MAESGAAIDPIHQFNISRVFDMQPMGMDVSFTNASLFMLITIALVTLFMVAGTSGRHLVPTRLQAAAEMTYEFIASTVRNTAGHEGMKFFPFVFSLFIFVLFSNLIGLIPYTFSVASQIVVTFALAATVITIVIVYGFIKNGTHFLAPVRAVRRAQAAARSAHPDRGDLLPVAADLALSTALREHSCGPHHACRCSAVSCCC